MRQTGRHPERVIVQSPPWEEPGRRVPLHTHRRAMAKDSGGLTIPCLANRIRNGAGSVLPAEGFQPGQSGLSLAEPQVQDGPFERHIVIVDVVIQRVQLLAE